MDNKIFQTKKGRDFQDLKIICRTIYNGGHRIEEIKTLILKLSYTINNYRLSSGLGPAELCTTGSLSTSHSNDPKKSLVYLMKS